MWAMIVSDMSSVLTLAVLGAGVPDARVEGAMVPSVVGVEIALGGELDGADEVACPAVVGDEEMAVGVVDGAFVLGTVTISELVVKGVVGVSDSLNGPPLALVVPSVKRVMVSSCNGNYTASVRAYHA